MSSEEKKPQESQEQQVQETAEKEQAVCGQSCADTQDRLLRVTADFQNYRARTEKERMHSMQLGQVAVLGKLLAIVDDVDRAIEEAKKKGEVDPAWLAGFAMIAKSLNQMLADHGVTALEQMKTFDPELHEALTQVDAPDHESGAIVDVLQKGYMFNDRVLRPAKVTVAK